MLQSVWGGIGQAPMAVTDRDHRRCRRKSRTHFQAAYDALPLSSTSISRRRRLRAGPGGRHRSGLGSESPRAQLPFRRGAGRSRSRRPAKQMGLEARHTKKVEITDKIDEGFAGTPPHRPCQASRDTVGLRHPRPGRQPPRPVASRRASSPTTSPTRTSAGGRAARAAATKPISAGGRSSSARRRRSSYPISRGSSSLPPTP